MANNIEEMLGSQQPISGQAQPQAGEQDENFLQTMDEISKNKKLNKKPTSEEKALSSEILNSMFMTGDNTEGMFTPEEKDEVDGVKLHEDQDEEAKADISDKEEDVKPQGKYKEGFKKDFLKHPEDYKIMTPRGEMTVAEAMKQGYNPFTKEFEEEYDNDNIKNKTLGDLNDQDRELIESMSDPSAAQIAPADAEKYGLKQGSPLLRQEQPMPGAEFAQGQQPTPPQNMAEAIPGATPQGVPPQQNNQADLAALLGQGGM